MVKSDAEQKGMYYSKDEFGKEILLRNGELQVMMEWEKPYMEACIDTLKPFGDVLEIGFGLGYAATRIQKYPIRSHTIIESDPAVIEKAKQWAKKYPNIKIVEGMWQEVITSLDIYDSIFFDDYTPLSPDEIKQLAQSAKLGANIAEEVRSLRESLEESLQQFKGIEFSDQDLQDFSKQLMTRRNTPPDDIRTFIENLADWGNITTKQRDAFLKEFENSIKPGRSLTSEQSTFMQTKQFPGDYFIAFIEECLAKHMRKGSKLSAYMGSPESKSRHIGFNQKILSKKDIRYIEKTIPVEVPENCQYYAGDQALIMVIEKA